MPETFWSPLAGHAESKQRGIWQRLDEQMRRLLDAIRVRRVQRTLLHFAQLNMSSSTTYSQMVLLGETAFYAYIFPRNGYIIDVAILINANLTASGYDFDLRVNGTSVGTYAITSSTTTQVGSTSYYQIVHSLDYGKASGAIPVQAGDIIEVYHRAQSGGVTPINMEGLVTLTYAMTGED